MRALFTFAGGSGHLDPLAPLAQAAAALGLLERLAAERQPIIRSRREQRACNLKPRLW